MIICFRKSFVSFHIGIQCIKEAITMIKMILKKIELMINILYFILCIFGGKVEGAAMKNIVLLLERLTTKLAKLNKNLTINSLAIFVPLYDKSSFLPQYWGKSYLRSKFINSIIIVLLFPIAVLSLNGMNYVFQNKLICKENLLVIGGILLIALTLYSLIYKDKYKRYLNILSKVGKTHIKTWITTFVVFIMLDILFWSIMIRCAL